MASLQVTMIAGGTVASDDAPVDIEQLVSTVPTAEAVYGDKTGSMFVTVDDARREELERILSPYCTVEDFERLDLFAFETL